MSHFRFPRTNTPIEQEMMNSVVLNPNVIHSDNILDSYNSNTLELSQNDNNYSSNSSVVSSTGSSDSSTILAPRQPLRNIVEERRCWICFGDSTDSQGPWVKPCKCTLEAHQCCLLEWIAENQKSSPTKKVHCPQCATPYQLVQKNSITLALLTVVDSLVRASAPYITVLGVGCSLLITCTTYGAFSVMTFFGSRDGERLIGNPSEWTFKTWVGLPFIPALLISTRTKWGDAILPAAAILVLRVAGATSRNIRFTWPLSPALTIGIMPWVRLFYKNIYRMAQRYLTKNLLIIQQNTSTITNNTTTRRRQGSTSVNITERERNIELDMINGRGTGSIGLSLLGALLWPVISSGIGGFLQKFKWVRHNFPEPFQRNVLGGCLFVVAKDIGNLIYKYERIRQFRSRRVKNYDEVTSD
ncbi:uncharacterized protein BX663DRAFT_499905 [Cokeromyces recurvatus]|uniref:uncharacterized protein n=1 Tax=Cokeromyces recurvatus TaxID=90255 RepID=UPI00221F3864|nr:uncharacterized protein BX663DRAFT_499905 [Cokeromyces recurvatus]KAI7905489.1 hypothetical protein BX663DRAFT_499905 [Cokeromyces recurvatus]